MNADLSSAPVAEPGEGDHVRGAGPVVVLYLDLACPHCAADWVRVRELPLRLCVRHFPIESKRPRAPALHRATEAAAALGGETAFWGMWDSLMEDQGHQDDPHLWQRAERLGLDVERFDAERRSEGPAERVLTDFHGGIRAGVIGTPSAFVAGEQLRGEIPAQLKVIAAGA